MAGKSRASLVLAAALVLHGCGGPGGAGPQGGGSGPGPGKARPALQVQKRYFPDGAPWYRDVSSARVSPESGTITAWMVRQRPPYGFGGRGNTMKVDFSIAAVEVPEGTAKRAYKSAPDFYYSPDCDTAEVPVPAGGAVEQSYGSPVLFDSPFSGYACAGFDKGDDCHMLLLARWEDRLYEIYHGTITGSGAGVFQAGCLAIWDLSMAGPGGRGQQCSSADAAGFSVAALLFSPEEVRAGTIDHAIRFILPNSMIRARKYVAPATHGTGTTGPDSAGPYGFRMRLRADYPVAFLKPAAQVVARALQKYGMLLSDGGNIALTAQSDVLSDVKWGDLGFDADALQALKATDFEVIDFETPTNVTFQCRRQPITK